MTQDHKDISYEIAISACIKMIGVAETEEGVHKVAAIFGGNSETPYLDQVDAMADRGEMDIPKMEVLWAAKERIEELRQRSE